MKRRRNGEGTIYKYKSGWTAAIFVEGDDGTTRRHFVYGATHGEVADKLKQLKKAQDKGERVGSTMTVEDYLNHWLDDVLPGTLRPSTERSYRDIVTRHIVPIIGTKTLRNLTTTDVRKFLQKKSQEDSARGRKHSARSIQYMHAILRRALGRAVKDEIIVRNVAALVDPPRLERKEVKPFTQDQALALLKTSEPDRLHALYVLALSLGLRKGELLGLSWDDIDFEAKTLRVRSSLQRNGDDGLTLSEPKTSRSRRTIPLPRFCFEALQDHQRRQRRERDKSAFWSNELNLVFTTSLGTPLEPRNMTRHFQTLCDRAGVPRLRFHDMRHTCASLLLAQGVDARVIMDTLGHSMIGTTMNLYTHVLPVTQRAAADKMDLALGKSIRGENGERGL